MKDDLVEGREAMRLDDLERQELMTVQLDEARDFLARGTVAHARLAFILLDNAAKVIMRRNIEAALTGNRLLEHIRDRSGEILTENPGNAEARRQHDKVESEIVSRSARKVLADKFDPKVDFIRAKLDEHVGPGLGEAAA